MTRPGDACMRAPDHARLYWVWQEKDGETGEMHEFALPVEDGPRDRFTAWPALIVAALPWVLVFLL